jgi:hypothetical protein
MFDSRVGNLGMMFQFEVNNMMQRLGHDIGFKSPARMAKVMIYSHLFNTAMEQLMGRRPLLDPIQAGADAVTQKKEAKDSTLEDLLKRGGRIGGEILSNMPAGQTLAQIIPDSQRKKYLGKTDVGMYPGGAPLVSAIQRGIKDPKSLLTSFVTPFGGGQISKILKAYNASQDVKDLSMGEKIKANIFGPSSAGLVKRKGKYRRLKKEKE